MVEMLWLQKDNIISIYLIKKQCVHPIYNQIGSLITENLIFGLNKEGMTNLMRKKKTEKKEEHVQGL